MNAENINSINIIQELNNEDQERQDAQVENERLKATCVALDNKVSITEDLEAENKALKNRLEENEKIREILEAKCLEHEKERAEHIK